MAGHVSLTRNKEIGIVTIDNPPVNAFSPGIPRSIATSIEQLGADPRTAAIVLIGAGRGFSAGADIEELQRIASGHQPRAMDLRILARRIEDCPKPVVCAIHGVCLGGGLEIALGAHYRIAAPSGSFAQPEVKIGLIPGAGGTQRLPRVAGVARALEMCWRGEPAGAEQALADGIVDRIVSNDLLTAAIAFARETLARGGKPPRTRDRDEKLTPERYDPAIFDAARAAARKSMRGQTAPLRAIEAVEASTRLPFDEAMALETSLFEKCLYSEQGRALIHVFFSERNAAKVPGLAPDAPALPVKQAAVAGAGTMGGGIAMTFANAGIPVALKEATRDALDRGVERIRSNYAVSVKRGRFTQAFADERMELIRPSLDYDGFADADVIVEAVFEDMELKKGVFAELDRVAKPDALLATNTSSLDIDSFAGQTSRAGMVLGLHFFSPANVMRLLEIVRGAATTPTAIATAVALARKLNKVPVVVGNCLGFAGNRMFEPYRLEAQFLVEEGAAPETVDRALYDFGMAMGPLATGDLVGLDVAWRIRRLFQEREPPGFRKPLVEDRLYDLGRYGQKSGAGWYRYDENRKPQPDAEVAALTRQLAAAAGIPQREIAPEEIVERTIYALVNEGARILGEGIAQRAADLDIIYVAGFGFPAWRGGPIWYAGEVGLAKVYARIREFEREHGPRWAPAPLLCQLAEQGRSFSE
ncbi:MAG: enoyl-CoA hydratase/isomerase family protein [Bryobacteraceae bacterium]|nr:enoyl-CoA hydratase/isomerase family protein [Bryobacteraceae bacterium]